MLGAILLAGLLAPFAAGQVPSPVARVDGVEISSEDLARKVGDRDLKARTEEYSARAFALSQLIDAAVLADEAKKRGISVEELLRVEVDSKIHLPSIDDARVAYEATHPAAKAPPTDEELQRLVESLKLRRVANAHGAYIEELRRQRTIETFLDPPRASRSVEATGPTQGRPDAPVTIVEFSDFQCPYCAAEEKILAQVKETYSDKLRFVFRNLPLAFHANAQIAAEAALCADRQGKFWEMHDNLFAHQSALALSDLVGYAADLGLDKAGFQHCMESHETMAAIAADRLTAFGLDITGTPAFLVNGQLLTGAATLAQFTQIIDRDLRQVQRKAASPR